MSSSIFQFVPEGWTLEPHQTRLLRQYEAIPDYVKLRCILAPVASGKSLLEYVIANYEAARTGLPATIVMRDNALVNQLARDFPNLALAPRRGGHSDSSWTRAKAEFDKAPVRLANLHQHLALRAYPHTLCVDEAHQLQGVMQDMEGVTLWEHLSGHFPEGRSMEDIVRWLSHEHDRPEAHPLLAKALKLIEREINNITYEWGEDLYRGVERRFLRVFPLTPRNNKPVFWPPRKTQRIVLLSATLAQDDIVDIGLDRSPTKWLECASPIPVSRRLCIYEPFGNMSYFKQRADIRGLAEGISYLAGRHTDERGFIHTTYGLASPLAAALRGTSCGPRIITHTKFDKMRKFREWQETPNGIFIASGMAEGIDLAYDKARWQVISKVQWPNKRDRAIQAKMEMRESWYAWETLKLVMQQYGRVCRRPDDEGVTYIVDSQFENLWDKGGHLAAKWFSEALR